MFNFSLDLTRRAPPPAYNQAPPDSVSLPCATQASGSIGQRIFFTRRAPYPAYNQAPPDSVSLPCTTQASGFIRQRFFFTRRTPPLAYKQALPDSVSPPCTTQALGFIKQLFCPHSDSHQYNVLDHRHTLVTKPFLRCQICGNAFGVIYRKAWLDFSLDIEYVLIVDRYKLMKIFLKVKIIVVFIVTNHIQFSHLLEFIIGDLKVVIHAG